LRAPMTSVFMVLEVSGNYSIILPVIVANTVAYVISRGLEPVAIFDVLTRQDGLDLPSMEEQREEDIIRVEDAMRPPVRPIDANEALGEVLQRDDYKGDVLLVRLHPSGWSSVEKKEIETMVKEGKGDLTLGSVLATRRVPFVHPDHPVDMALRYVDRYPLVPVVNRADYRKLEGVITLDDVIEAYQPEGAD
jgi:chloride channel protein, CIC family